jgi:uncharacterized membrane protein
LGGLLALCAAATFALNNTLMRRGVLSGSVVQAMSITVPLGVPLMFVVALLLGALPELEHFTFETYAAFSGAGIAHFVIGRYFNYRAVQAIGTNLSGPLVESSVVVALILAVIFLDEKLTVIKIIGIILVMSGPLVISEKGDKKDKKEKGADQLGFTPKYIEGYVYSVFAALAYGASPILVRVSLQHTTWQASIAGGLVSYIAATVVMFLVVVLCGQVRHVCQLSWHSAKWFCGAGFFVGISQLLRYVALSFAPVSVVSPIHRVSLIFRLIFSYMINRKYEIFASGMILGTMISIVGAMLLSISEQSLREWLNLSGWVALLLQWSWPSAQ